jgi:hypothetical protein
MYSTFWPYRCLLPPHDWFVGGILQLRIELCIKERFITIVIYGPYMYF